MVAAAVAIELSGPSFVEEAASKIMWLLSIFLAGQAAVCELLVPKAELDLMERVAAGKLLAQVVMLVSSPEETPAAMTTDELLVPMVEIAAAVELMVPTLEVELLAEEAAGVVIAMLIWLEVAAVLPPMVALISVNEAIATEMTLPMVKLILSIEEAAALALTVVLISVEVVVTKTVDVMIPMVESAVSVEWAIGKSTMRIVLV